MSSRIELTLVRSHAAGFLCALPWLALALFIAAAAQEFGTVYLSLVIPALAGAAFQYRRTGLLIGRKAVVGLRVENGQLYACLGSGQVKAVEVSGESRLSAHLAILKLRHSDTISPTYPVLLMTIAPRVRNVPSDAFRHLRAWLRLGQSSGGKAPRHQGQEIH